MAKRLDSILLSQITRKNDAFGPQVKKSTTKLRQIIPNSASKLSGSRGQNHGQAVSNLSRLGPKETDRCVVSGKATEMVGFLLHLKRSKLPLLSVNV